MPAYTHLQPAQVTTFAHYLLGFFDLTDTDSLQQWAKGLAKWLMFQSWTVPFWSGAWTRVPTAAR